MTQTIEICLPTPLSTQVFGRPEDWEWIEADTAAEVEAPEPLKAAAAELEEQRLSA